MGVSFEVTKLDAARRQLDVAVRLYFGEDDSIAIHTLTAAAHQVLSDLIKSSGKTSTIKDTFLSYVRKDKLKEARKALNAAENFFKHAERDPHAVLKFFPTQTEILLLDACVMYHGLTGEVVPTLGAYQTWFWLGPGAELVDVTKDRRIEEFRKLFRGATRRSFLADVVPILNSIRLSRQGD